MLVSTEPDAAHRMTTLFKQLEALSGPSNKALKRFRREYASREYYYRIVVSESWDHMLQLDPDFIKCEGIFRRWLSDVGSEVILPASKSTRVDSTNNDVLISDKIAEWEDKDVEFMQESEVAELEATLQLFLDLCAPWISYDQCHRLFDYLIYQYEMATRFADILLLALIPIHDSEYFSKVTEMLCLPEGSELRYYLPERKSLGKASSNDTAATAQGVSREFIVAATVRSFINYKRIGETVERITITRRRGGAYIPLFTVLTIAFVEHNGMKLGDDEIRLLLNNAFSGLKNTDNAAYHASQLCALSALFASVPITIQVQRSVVTALLNPLLKSIIASSGPSLSLRLQLKDALVVVVGMIQRQKERLEVLPPESTRLLVKALHKFPSLTYMFRGFGSSGDALDLSRFCKMLTLSVIKACKQRQTKGSSTEKVETPSSDLVAVTVNFFMSLEYSILYVRMMISTILDDLVVFSMSCKDGESLFQWNPNSMTGRISDNHNGMLSVHVEFLKEIYASSPSVFEDLLNRLVMASDRSNEILPVFLLICHSVSDGCPLKFTVMVHKCLGSNIDVEKTVLPKSVIADNLASTLFLYTDSSLPSSYRVELYKMLSSVMTKDMISSINYSLLKEFVRVSISDQECSPIFFNDRAVLDGIPVSIIGEVVGRYIASLLQDKEFRFLATMDVKVKGKFPVIDPSNFYDKCFEVLSAENATCKQLMRALSLFCHFFSLCDGTECSSMEKQSRHFMSLLNVVYGRHKTPRKISMPDGSSNKNAENSDLMRKPVKHKGANKAVNQPTLASVCCNYFGKCKVANHQKYEEHMALLLSVIDFMEKVSTAKTYASTLPGEDSADSIQLSENNPAWCNEWLICHALFVSCGILIAAAKKECTFDTALEKDVGLPTTDVEPSSDVEPLSIYQCRNLFAASEVVVGYALKLCKGSIVVGDMTYCFARCQLKVLTLYTLYAPSVTKCEQFLCRDENENSNEERVYNVLDSDVAIDRDILLLHTMISLSNDDFISDFKDALSKAPKGVQPRCSLWLKHFFEFGRFSRSSERRPGARLDMYSNISEGYVEIIAPMLKVRISNVICDCLKPGISLIFDALKGVFDTRAVPLPEEIENKVCHGTLRIGFLYLLDSDNVLKMYTRSMNMLSHLVCELLRQKVYNNSCLMVDVMANTLEFVVDKELSIRRPAVSMLFTVMKAFMEVPCKPSGPFVSLCGYKLSSSYAKGNSTVESHIKGLDKSFRRFCTTLMEKHDTSPNSMFSSQLFEMCSQEPILSSALLYAYLFSGSSLQFNNEVLRSVIDVLPSELSTDAFGAALHGIFQQIEAHDISDSSTHLDIMYCLLCSASLVSSMSMARFKESSVFFASTLCPAIFKSVSLLFSKGSYLNGQTHESIQTIRSLASLCALIGVSGLSGGRFWNLKGEVQTGFLEALNRVFPILDGYSRQQCLSMITAGYDSTKSGMKPLVTTINRLNDFDEHFMEQFVLGIISQASLELLFDAFTAVLHHEKSTTYGLRISCLILQRFMITADFNSDEAFSVLCKGCTSLMDNVVKYCKCQGEVVASVSDESPMTHLSHVSNFISILYRRLYRALDTVEPKGVQKLNNIICRCLSSLAQIYGSAIFDFVAPYLPYACAVGMHLSCHFSVDTESSEASLSGRGGFGAICEVMMSVIQQDKSLHTLLKFVDLCVVFSDRSSRDALTKTSGPRPEQKMGSNQTGYMQMHKLYDEWLCYSLYTCIFTGRFDKESPVILRCLELLKSSNDALGVLCRLIFTMIYSVCDGIAEYVSKAPRLDMSAAMKGKHPAPSSGLDAAYDIYAFVLDVVASHSTWVVLEINADSFNDYKSLEYQRFLSLSLLLQCMSLSLVCFKNTSDDEAWNSLTKKKKGPMGLCLEASHGSSNDLPASILKIVKEISRCIYDANPPENRTRLALGALSFFGKVEQCDVATNYWSDVCDINLQKKPWVCFYIASSLAMIANDFGSKFSIQDKKKENYAAFSKELSRVTGNLVRVLTDSIIATDACISGSKSEAATNDLLLRGRKTVWRCLIGLSGHVYGEWASPCLLLTSSRLDMLLQHKSPSEPLLMDFINSMKMCIRIVYASKDDLGGFDLNLVRQLSLSLSKLTSHLVQHQNRNSYLYLCVISMMLLLRSSFGRVTGDELLESILNVILFYSSSEIDEERFPLPVGEDVTEDKELNKLCREIFEELLSCNSEKLVADIQKAHEANEFKKATCTRVLTLLSFYASISCKYQHLLTLVLGLDFSQVAVAMRDTSRLLSIIAISLHYNRIKSKHIADLERIYFLNVNLLSDFELSYQKQGKNKPRKSTAPGNLESDTANALAAYGASIRRLYCGSDAGRHLDMSCNLFGSMQLSPADIRGVKLFEDSVIAFSLQYFSKIQSNELVEVFANHMSMLQAFQKKMGSSSLPMDGIRLFLRVLSATLAEYGSVGATQFVLPRVYQFLNTILDGAVNAIQGEVTDKGKNSAKEWKSFVNGILVIQSIGICVETWDSKQASVPEMFLNAVLPTIGRALDVFDVLQGNHELEEWGNAIETLFLHLVSTCSDDVDRIELVLSGNLVARSTKCKCHILNILLSLWNKASFHMGGTVVNVMPMVGELVEDESTEVQRLAEMLNEKIQSFLNAN